jgi:hypothetical protein
MISLTPQLHSCYAKSWKFHKLKAQVELFNTKDCNNVRRYEEPHYRHCGQHARRRQPIG